MCRRMSDKCVNVLIGFTLFFLLVVFILGILSYGLPYHYISLQQNQTGLFQICNGVQGCTSNPNVYNKSEWIAVYTMFAVGMLFNLIALLIVIISIGISKRRFNNVYIKFALRVITFVILFISASSYMISMIIETIYVSNTYKKERFDATYITAWITFAFAVLAAFAMAITLCRCTIRRGSLDHSPTSKTNKAYEPENYYTTEEDVSKDVYRMYTRY